MTPEEIKKLLELPEHLDRWTEKQLVGYDKNSQIMRKTNEKNAERFKKLFIERRKNFSSEKLSESGKKGISKMKTEDRSKGGKKAGAKNVESGHLASLRTKEHQSNAGKIANNKKVICPDGHITSKPSATFYCKKRNLDVTKCKEISLEEYKRLKGLN